jgi:hypothetical protein
VDNVRSFDEFLERKFPESRRKAYYLMAIHEQLPRIHKVELQQVGWTKATELAKVARRDGRRFDSATWLHKARELPKEEFKREVSKHRKRTVSAVWTKCGLVGMMPEVDTCDGVHLGNTWTLQIEPWVREGRRDGGGR